MLTPLASAGAAAIVSTMQSILDTLEERRREEAEKASGQKRDDTPKANLQSDETARQANARINAHFFGSDARNDNTLAKLVSRFADALGLSQRDGESSRAFAKRLADAVTLVDSVALGDKPLSVTLTSLGTTLDAVKTAIAGGKTDDPTAALVARLADANGVRQGVEETDADFEARLSAMLTEQRGQGPKDVEALEKQSGLAALGLKASDLIAAIANPYGSEAARVKDALADKAREEKTLTPEMRKVLARLEDAADPKSIEELKAARVQRDPTRVEDAETRAEREEQIRALEAGEKLKDVRKLQEAVGEAHKAAAGKGEEAADDPVADALSTIQLLAAGADAAKRAEQTKTGPDEADAAAPDQPAETTDEALRKLDEAGTKTEEAREEARKDVFTLRVDENGVYDLITRQLAA
ncbi:hypothetical protein [Shinella pollutisoli]|uniref:Uncharacterized protein n=1 Tax=Shinella pollutisoli TaxID=2250594 RepID=A0ABV7DJG1_9HYPH|nr:hypothetical protein [Shinella pollutisoli]